MIGRTGSFLSALVFIFGLAAGMSQTSANQATTPTLRVALYPYVPEARALFFELEAAFERAHAVNLELVEIYVDEAGKEQQLSWYYYDGGLLQTEADVYEIDTILLRDMVQAGKIVAVDLPSHSFRPEAVAAVTLDETVWAVPHWVCGNFLFFRNDDRAIHDAKTWHDLMLVFESSGQLLVDLKGRSTLGEWYLTSLAAAGLNASEILNVLGNESLDEKAVDRLADALRHCEEGYCRSDSFHDRTGFYARQFARGRARAYVGYSESIHYALREISESCGPTDGCLAPSEIAVREIPGDGPDSHQVGWVDALGVASSLDPEKARLATEFVRFATSWNAHQIVLEPEWPDPPRYLLPAVSPLDGDAPLSPRLYSDFYTSFGSRLTLTDVGLNKRLREHGATLDCRLPPVRTELRAWLQTCREL